jgi:hypothetical protein
MVASVIHSLSVPRGMVLALEGRSFLLNRRWRTVPLPTSSETSYEWELQSRSLAPGSPFILRIFTDEGIELRRNARCPLFLPNYISLDSPNVEGVDEIFRSNTIYYLDATKCVLQNTWFTDSDESERYGPYFLNAAMPVMTSVAVCIR